MDDAKMAFWRMEEDQSCHLILFLGNGVIDFYWRWICWGKFEGIFCLTSVNIFLISIFRRLLWIQTLFILLLFLLVFFLVHNIKMVSAGQVAPSICFHLDPIFHTLWLGSFRKHEFLFLIAYSLKPQNEFSFHNEVVQLPLYRKFIRPFSILNLRRLHFAPSSPLKNLLESDP